MKDKKKIIFVCAENAGRSQMAGAFFNAYAKNRGYNAESAGTVPAGEVNPAVIEVMKEKGIDMLNAKPKQFDESRIDEYARIISFGCLLKEAFSTDIQKRIEDWVTDDPKGKPVEDVRIIRDSIEKKVRVLIEELLL